LLRAVCKIEGHFDAEGVVSQLDHEDVAVSQATVYRTLPLFEQAGIIRRVGLDRPSEKTIYEHVWGRQHHDHLLCSACGAVVEFTDPAIEVLQEAVAKRHGFELHSHHLDLVGLCLDCAAGREQSR
jgi:Fur family ferric uptake transcriptional regulator